MTGDSKQAIQNYIRRVTELSQSKDTIPTEQELASLAIELGIDWKEVQLAQEEAQRHSIRAEGYLKYRKWNDAIAELEQANILNPANTEILYSLAFAYAGRWKNSKDKKDEQKIRRLIKQCLEIQPNHSASLTLLNRFDRRVGLRRWKRKFVLTASLSGLSLTIGLGAIFASNPQLLSKLVTLQLNVPDRSSDQVSVQLEVTQQQIQVLQPPQNQQSDYAEEELSTQPSNSVPSAVSQVEEIPGFTEIYGQENSSWTPESSSNISAENGGSEEASLTREAAVDLVQRWMLSKAEIFAPPFNTRLVEEMTTSTLKRDLLGSNGILAYLKQRNALFQYENQAVHVVEGFIARKDTAVIQLKVSENSILISNGQIDNSHKPLGTASVRYYLKFENQTWKIQDYKTVE